MFRYSRWYLDGYSSYRVYYTNYSQRAYNTRIGVVRLANRGSGLAYTWEYSTDGENWYYASPSSRDNASRALVAMVYGVEAPESTARRTPRRRAPVRRDHRAGRAFGVELELTGPSSSIIIDALRAHGIDCENVGTYRNTNGSRWELKHDGSVGGNGLELVSPKLYGQPGFEELKKVCEALVECGATVDRSCGLHVHHDMRGLELESIKRQVLAFVDRQSLISMMIQPSRRSGHTYCPTWNETSRNSLNRMTTRTHNLRDLSYVGPRGNINLQSYGAHGSAEIRWHGGSINYRKIAAWIRFGQSLFKAAEAQEDLPSDTLDNLLGVLRRHGLTVEDSATLLRFQRMGQTRSQVEESIREAQEMMAEVGER